MSPCSLSALPCLLFLAYMAVSQARVLSHCCKLCRKINRTPPPATPTTCADFSCHKTAVHVFDGRYADEVLNEQRLFYSPVSLVLLAVGRASTACMPAHLCDSCATAPAACLCVPAVTCRCAPCSAASLASCLQECGERCLGTALSSADYTERLLLDRHWVSMEVDLTQYKGKNIIIAFRVASTNSVWTDIDNVQVVAAGTDTGLCQPGSHLCTVLEYNYYNTYCASDSSVKTCGMRCEACPSSPAFAIPSCKVRAWRLLQHRTQGCRVAVLQGTSPCPAWLLPQQEASPQTYACGGQCPEGFQQTGDECVRIPTLPACSAEVPAGYRCATKGGLHELMHACTQLARTLSDVAETTRCCACTHADFISGWTVPATTWKKRMHHLGSLASLAATGPAGEHSLMRATHSPSAQQVSVVSKAGKSAQLCSHANSHALLLSAPCTVNVDGWLKYALRPKTYYDWNLYAWTNTNDPCAGLLVKLGACSRRQHAQLASSAYAWQQHASKMHVSQLLTSPHLRAACLPACLPACSRPQAPHAAACDSTGTRDVVLTQGARWV